MKNALFALAFIPLVAFGYESVDPIAGSPGNTIKDTTTISLKSGSISIERECTDFTQKAWTSSSLKISSGMVAEAASKNIKQDLVWIEIKTDDDCNYTHYSIPEPGELETLNSIARNFCKEIIFTLDTENLKNPFACPQDKCENIMIPVSVNFY